MAALHLVSFTTPRPWSEQEFRELLQQPHIFCQTLDKGFVLGRRIADEAELLTIAVAPAARRTGVGRRLLHAFLSEMDRKGVTTTFLEVASENVAASALYRSAGFAQVGERKDYYLKGDGARLSARVFARKNPRSS